MFGTSTGMRLCLILLEVEKSENRFTKKLQRKKRKKNFWLFFHVYESEMTNFKEMSEMALSVGICSN